MPQTHAVTATPAQRDFERLLDDTAASLCRLRWSNQSHAIGATASLDRLAALNAGRFSAAVTR